LFLSKQRGVYNPTRTLYYLTGIQEFFQDNPASVPRLTAEEIYNKIPNEANSLPAKSTLQMMSNNYEIKPIIEKLLQSDTNQVFATNGLQVKFTSAQLRSMTGNSALISYMYYHGALTLGEPIRPEDTIIDRKFTKFGYKIPNNVARIEFVEELCSIMRLNDDATTLFKNGVTKMLTKDTIDDLCKAIEDCILNSMRGRDVKEGEDAFKNIFIDALLIGRTIGVNDRVERELKMLDKNSKSRYFDAVYISKEYQKIFGFSFKDIRAEYITELTKDLKKDYGSFNWDDLCTASVKLDEMTPDEISKLQATSYEDKKLSTKTIEKFIENAKNEVRDNYLIGLEKIKKKHEDEGKQQSSSQQKVKWELINFVVKRVGMRKILIAQV